MVSFKWSIFGLRLFLTVWQFLYLKVAFPCLCGLIIPGHLGDQTWHVRTSGQVLQLLYLCLVMQTVTKLQMSKSVHSKVPVHSPSPRNPTFFKNSVYHFFFSEVWIGEAGGGGGGLFWPCVLCLLLSTLWLTVKKKCTFKTLWFPKLVAH